MEAWTGIKGRSHSPCGKENSCLFAADGCETGFQIGKGLLGKQLLYTARQKDGVLTLDVPAEVATFRTTIEDMQALQASGVKTLVVVTEKNTTTLNLSLLCEGQKSGTRVTLRHLGSSATLSVGLRCRRDLLIGR